MKKNIALSERDWARACGWGSGPHLSIDNKMQPTVKVIEASCEYKPKWKAPIIELSKNKL